MSVRPVSAQEYAPLDDEEARARARLRRKADFNCPARVDGRQVNIMKARSQGAGRGAHALLPAYQFPASRSQSATQIASRI